MFFDQAFTIRFSIVYRAALQWRQIFLKNVGPDKSYYLVILCAISVIFNATLSASSKSRPGSVFSVQCCRLVKCRSLDKSWGAPTSSSLNRVSRGKLVTFRHGCHIHQHRVITWPAATCLRSRCQRNLLKRNGLGMILAPCAHHKQCHQTQI